MIFILAMPLEIVSFISVMSEPTVQNICQAWFSKLPEKCCRANVQRERGEIYLQSHFVLQFNSSFF